MKWPTLVPLVLALGTLLFTPGRANAWTELLSMDALPELSGWTPASDSEAGSSGVVGGGILDLTAEHFRHYRAPGSWVGTVVHDAGFTVEFRVRIDAKGSCFPAQDVGLWIHDNTYLTILSFDPDRIYVAYPSFPLAQPTAALDATAWHTYRLVAEGTHHRVFVDGAVVLDYVHPTTGGGSTGLYFGDLGDAAWPGPGCGASRTQWDYVAYETGAVVPVISDSWGKLKTLYRGGR